MAKKVGRPKKVGAQAPAQIVAARYSKGLLGMVDDWRRKQSDLPSRSEATRRLVELGLASSQPVKSPGKRAASKAAALAGEQIDRLQHGRPATAQEREGRKRRLLKGPKEFREMRAPKTKD
jgi:hypothetical protein